jgi:OCT family organic cation transporter-like MFS transporter 4/5
MSNKYKDVLQSITVSCSTKELVYDKSVVTSSFSIDHEFVCDRYYLKGIFNSLYMVGMLIGAFILGIIADRWGRRSAFFISTLLVGSAGIISPFISSTIFFGLLRIVEGMGGMGCFFIPYVMIAESTLPK